MNVSGRSFKAHKTALRGIVTSSDGRHIATLAHKNEIAVWDIQNIEHPRKLFELTKDQTVDWITLDHNAQTLALLHEDENDNDVIELWDIGSRTKKFDYPINYDVLPEDENDNAILPMTEGWFALSPNGRYVIIFDEKTSSYITVDSQEKKVVHSSTWPYIGDDYFNKTGTVVLNHSHQKQRNIDMRLDKSFTVVINPHQTVLKVYLGTGEPPEHISLDRSSISEQGNKATTELWHDGASVAQIWELPVGYLKGEFSWSDLQELLKKRCFAIVPHQQPAEAQEE